MAHVFISYATPDRVIADEVSGWLRAAGHEPFLDLAPGAIRDLRDPDDPDDEEGEGG